MAAADPPADAAGATGILQVAVDCPLRSLLDYLPPPGQRARICRSERVCACRWARRSAVGVIVAHADRSMLPAQKLRRITELLDREPLFDDATARTAALDSELLPASARRGVRGRVARGIARWLRGNRYGNVVAADGGRARGRHAGRTEARAAPTRTRVAPDRASGRTRGGARSKRSMPIGAAARAR